ncbi:MAG: GspE/PulE family protein [Patescibacteria group bacterium]|nr:GspE/PulE family protein [Patescibacteria group bacterium]
MDFLDYLVKQKAVSQKQAKEIKDESVKSGRVTEELLAEKKILLADKMAELKSQFLDVPLKKVVLDEISPEIFSLIPKTSVEFYKIVPLGLNKDKKVLDVGMVFPEDQQAQEALKFLTRQLKISFRVFLISLSDFQKYSDKYRSPEREVQSALKKLEDEISAGKAEEKKEIVITSGGGQVLQEEAPIIKMVAVILRQAVEGRASDIHIEPTTSDLRVRFRLDGILYPSLVLPLKAHPAIIARIKILTRLKIDETRLPQDGRFSTQIGDKKIDFRVATFPTTLGEKVVIRVLDASSGAQSLEALGFSSRDLGVLKEAIKKPHGMILVTGPTGSGKTTTLYTVLGILNKETVNIVTLEDPVEYFMNGVNQSQVNSDISYTFARGLRQILRQDPNIIMVGEIRDEETADLAVNAALTGHLVLSTLHTTSAVGLIPRLLDMGVKSFLLSPTLSVAVSQRLVRVLCPQCKQRIKPDIAAKQYILGRMKNFSPADQENFASEESWQIFTPKGCKNCGERGYLGRVGVFEVLSMTENLSEIIAKGVTEKALSEEVKQQHMTTMEEDGVLKVLKGITTIEEVMRVAEEK